MFPQAAAAVSYPARTVHDHPMSEAAIVVPRDRGQGATAVLPCAHFESPVKRYTDWGERYSQTTATATDTRVCVLTVVGSSGPTVQTMGRSPFTYLPRVLPASDELAYIARTPAKGPKTAKQQPLVFAHIKGVSVKAIQKHLKCFREFIGRRKCGVYVLRTDGDIFYIGLASSLRSRLADHLTDHLQGKWDQFDLYIIRKGKAKYLKELEALLIRVAKPSANKTEPKFVEHNNVTKQFKEALHKEIAAL